MAMELSEEIFEKLKVKSLEFRVSDSSADENNQKYRTIFYLNEQFDLKADFNYFNKKFDEEYWDDLLILIIYRMEGEKKIDIHTRNLYIEGRTEDNIVRHEIKFAMGDENVQWGEGLYRCEITYFEHILIANEFSIVAVNSGESNLFEIKNLKLFEGPEKLPEYSQRSYLSKFQGNATRFIWAELEIRNLQPDKNWKAEFFFNYYNDIKELHGRVSEKVEVDQGDKNNLFTIYAGLGDEKTVSWDEDLYTLEIVFQNKVIAVANFEVGTGTSGRRLSFEILNAKKRNKESKIENDKGLFDELDELVGLETIKQKLHDYYSYVKYLKLREEKGLDSLEDLKLNFVFTGNPGTGKTTIAKMLGKIYKQLGLLSSDTVFEVDRGDLVGRYIGETAPQTKEIIEKARGGILFIDEAYALYRDDEKDFGKEAIEVIVKELSDGKGDLAIIVAGYPDKMKDFISSNAGLESRFNFWYEFPDYTPDELLKIAKLMVDKKKLLLSEDASEMLHKMVVEAYRNRDKHFGNARYISSIVEESQVNLGLRIMQTEGFDKFSAKQLSTIGLPDIEKIKNAAKSKAVDLPINEELLRDSLKKLNSLTGLSTVKTEIHELVKLTRFYKESSKEILNSISLHNVFLGNPGTGKTTVARIIADIYKALGLLERGHLVECDRDDLVAGYVGQTAIKTHSKIEEAIGGILFIDEAYSLNSGTMNDFGGEAIEVILKAMEDRRGEFSVVAAGYTNEMINFLESNPGLKSRFDNVIEFEDYSADELMIISKSMLRDSGLEITEEAEEHLDGFINYQLANKDKYFGNARFIRKIIDKIIKNLHLRLAELPADRRTGKVMNQIILDDVDDFIPSKDFVTRSRGKIGF